MKKAKYIWMDGKFVKWDDAKIHLLSHVVHYGSGVFEGFRAYKTKKGTAIFRLDDHIKRLFLSAKMYRMKIPHSYDKLKKSTIEIIKKNKLTSCYIRPIVYRGYETLGVDPNPCPINVGIAVWEWGSYLGKDALDNGVDVMVSSWRRMAPDTMPAMAKAVANYMNSQLIKMEALAYGFTEGIALDVLGYISEGSGENIFLVRDNIIYTPSFGSSILLGITRDSVIKIAKGLGYTVKEMRIPRDLLYTSDEVFFTGSAAEITPIRSIDKIPIGDGKKGNITKKLQDELFAILNGKKKDKFGWLTYVK